MRVKYWAGAIKSSSINHDEWLGAWIAAAKAAENEGSELIVFKIPIPKRGFSACGETIREIEELLQNKFKTR